MDYGFLSLLPPLVADKDHQHDHPRIVGVCQLDEKIISYDGLCGHSPSDLTLVKEGRKQQWKGLSGTKRS